jgi:hypothetical protein
MKPARARVKRGGGLLAENGALAQTVAKMTGLAPAVRLF